MNAVPFTIVQADGNHCELLADIIAEAFQTVAQQFNLSADNCPKHPSNCNHKWISDDLKRGVIYFVLKFQNTPIGCAGLEIVDDATAYLERLAVRPLHRHKGAGRTLVGHMVSTAKKFGVKRIDIGIIAADQRLKIWYASQGFQSGTIKHFAHLPFEVQFMSFPVPSV